MRLFLAYPLSSGVLAKIGFLEEKVENKIGFKLNWIPIKNLHLTILFLGHLNYEDYLKIEEIFKEEIDFKSFEIKIKKLDYGPPGKKRMIWLYVEKNENLEKIKKYFEEKLEEKRVAYKREERDYLPHINLIRLSRSEEDFLKEREIKEELKWGIKIKEIALYQSFLKKTGAEYEKLKNIILK